MSDEHVLDSAKDFLLAVARQSADALEKSLGLADGAGSALGGRAGAKLWGHVVTILHLERQKESEQLMSDSMGENRIPWNDLSCDQPWERPPRCLRFGEIRRRVCWGSQVQT